MHRSHWKWLRWGLLLLLGAIVFLGLALWRQQAPASVSLLEPLPQDPLIQVYFNHSQANQYTEPYRQKERLGDDLEQVLVDAIASAQSSVDMAIHELRLPRVAQALVERQQSGVNVRVIVENTYSRAWSQVNSGEAVQLEERDRAKYEEFLMLADADQDGVISPVEAADSDAIVILQSAQVPLIDDTADGSKGSDLMHHKFAVIDHQILIVGSANFTTSDVHGDFLAPASLGNANHLLRIQSSELATLFTQEFELMWGDGAGQRADSLFGLQKPHRPAQTVRLTPNSTVTVQFSPTSQSLPWEKSVNGLISRALATATRSVDLALFVFSDQKLSNALEARHQQGAIVRALIDSGFAYRYYSEGLDLMGVALADNQCRHEPENQLWQTPVATVGVPLLPDGDLLHHKFAVVDDRLVITGSQNWSQAANESNDENLLVIDNTTVAAHFQREFDRLYKDAVLGVPTWLQEKVQSQTAQCRP